MTGSRRPGRGRAPDTGCGRRQLLIAIGLCGPPKTVEQVPKLVERDQVLWVFNMAGTPNNTAIHKYIKQKRGAGPIPRTGATQWGDPEHFPWTMGKIYAGYIRDKHPQAKIGVLYQNDDSGKDRVRGLRDGSALRPSR